MTRPKPSNAKHAATYRAKQAARVKAMEGVITEANNSLYGSQGMFMSTNGGPSDKYHLARPIEDMKAYSKAQWRRAERYKAALERIANDQILMQKWREIAAQALAPQGEK